MLSQQTSIGTKWLATGAVALLACAGSAQAAVTTFAQSAL